MARGYDPLSRLSTKELALVAGEHFTCLGPIGVRSMRLQYFKYPVSWIKSPVRSRVPLSTSVLDSVLDRIVTAEALLDPHGVAGCER